MKHVRRVCVCISLVACLNVFSVLCVHAVDARTSEKYDFSTWRGFTKLSYPSLVEYMPMPDLQLTTNASSEVGLRYEGGESRLEIGTGIELQLCCSIRICPSVVGAQEQIIGEFARMAKAVTLARQTNTVGDVFFYRNYGSQGERATFSRNNVYVSIVSDTAMFSATNIAHQIDAAILRASGVLR